MESERHLYEVRSCGVFCCPCRHPQGDGRRQKERNMQAENKKKQNKTKKQHVMEFVTSLI